MKRLCVLLLILSPAALTQTQGRNDTCGAKHLKQCALDIWHDQAGIWTSPLRLHAADAEWLLPFAGATTLAVYNDRQALRELGHNQNSIDTSHSISQFGSPEVTIGAGVGLYALGLLSKNDKLGETGRLGAEAVADASVVAEGIKLATNRDRPDQGERTGEFWPSGTKGYSTNGSFPSGHATASWALARVIAEEYRGFLPRLAAYGFATAVSVTRVTGRDHFPSDTLVGGGIGYLIGGYVYRHHSAANSENYLNIHPMIDARTRSYGPGVVFPLERFAILFRKRSAQHNFFNTEATERHKGKIKAYFRLYP